MRLNDNGYVYHFLYMTIDSLEFASACMPWHMCFSGCYILWHFVGVHQLHITIEVFYVFRNPWYLLFLNFLFCHLKAGFVKSNGTEMEGCSAVIDICASCDGSLIAIAIQRQVLHIFFFEMLLKSQLQHA